MAVKVDCADICDSFNTGQFCYMGDFRRSYFLAHTFYSCVSIISLSASCFIIFLLLRVQKPFSYVGFITCQKIS